MQPRFGSRSALVYSLFRRNRFLLRLNLRSIRIRKFSNSCGIFIIYPDNKITQNVHIVDKRLVWSVIRVEIFVDFTVGEELRAHIIEVVALLKMSEFIEQGRIIDEGELLVEAVQFVEGFLLEFVSEPCGNVALLVSP